MKKHWSESGGNYPNMIKSRMKSVFVIIVVVVSFIIILFSFSSCTTQRDIEKVCASGLCPTQIEYRDSISYIEKETITNRVGKLDSLMWLSTFDFSQFKDTITINDTIVQFSDNTWQISLVKDKYNRLMLHATHQGDSIKELNTLISKSDNKEEIKSIPVYVDVPKYNKFFYILLTWSILTIIFIVFVCIKKWQEMKFGWLKFMNKI